MALSIGARLGAYEILSALVAGGMGVNRARDTKLKRGQRDHDSWRRNPRLQGHG